jgi:hypothetical protein
VADNTHFAAGLVTCFSEHLFQVGHCMNRTVHVAPKTGKEDPATELAQPASQRAETQVTSKKAGDQHNCSFATTRIRKETVEKPIERERQVLIEEAIFAQQFCEAWTEFGFQRKHRLVPLDALDAAARLGFHMTLEVVEFVRGRRFACTRFAKGWITCAIGRGIGGKVLG